MPYLAIITLCCMLYGYNAYNHNSLCVRGLRLCTGVNRHALRVCACVHALRVLLGSPCGREGGGRIDRSPMQIRGGAPHIFPPHFPNS